MPSETQDSAEHFAPASKRDNNALWGHRGMKAGQRATLREVVVGRTWIERPCKVVAATKDELVVVCETGSRLRFPKALDDRLAFLDMWSSGEWEMGARVFSAPDVYRIIQAGVPFDVWFDLRAGSPWYINLQRPVTCTSSVLTTADWILDLIVSPDFQQVQVKDDDELEMALELKIFSQSEVDYIRGIGRKIRDDALAGNPPWDPDWIVKVSQLVCNTVETS